MKRYRIFAALICCLLLAGCGKTENPYRVDTVVRIPVNPTETTAAGEETTVPDETAEPSEHPETTEAAEATEETKAPSGSSGKKSSSGKATGKKNTSGGSESTKPRETEPPAVTEMPAEQPTEAPAEAPTEPPYDPSGYSVGSLEYAILEELNACRTEAGLAELSMSTRLCGISALRAREIAQVWSHTRPDGRNYTTAMSDYSYGFGTAAENLVHVSGSGDAAAIVEKWMNTDSQKHILREGFTTAGIGVYRTGGVTYIVNLLAG